MNKLQPEAVGRTSLPLQRSDLLLLLSALLPQLRQVLLIYLQHRHAQQSSPGLWDEKTDKQAKDESSQKQESREQVATHLTHLHDYFQADAKVAASPALKLGSDMKATLLMI